MATQRNRRNTISMLKDSDGRVVNDHDEIAALLWSSYRDRMGNSEGINMQFDLPRLINRIQGLEENSQPFLQEEIELVLKQMPPDNSPGPDGFTGLFLKRCWPIIKQDFFKLVQDFHEGTLQLQNINESFITLFPKVHSPESVNDYRPISLTNACLKFLTKLVANRLQQRILSCVHKNQYGFIKSRTIQDCVAWTFEYLYQCHASKKPVVIMKLDFAKAFDTIEHEAIIQVMRHMGFDSKTIQWVKDILSSGTSKILLNGVPGKQFFCKRGVRQGDPLSPILYVLGSELLQIVINDALAQGLLSLPIEVGDPDFPIVQYADDTLLILPAEMDQVVALKEILHKFSISTGLKVNYHKSSMVPINVKEEEMQQLANAFGAKLPRSPSLIWVCHWVQQNQKFNI
jgi:hypothetical protein